MNKIIVLLIFIIIIFLGGIGLLLNKNASLEKLIKSKLTIPFVGPTEAPIETKKPIGLPEKTFRVAISDQGFIPPIISIKKGETIVWINQSKNTVSINSDPHPTHGSFPLLNLGNVAAGESTKQTFSNEGTYAYHNHLNPSQTGTILVR